MKKLIIYTALALTTAATFTACQNKDYEEFPVQMQPINNSDVQASLQGDNYVITWSALGQGKKMQVARYINGGLNSTEVVEGTSYTHANVETNVNYTYVLKVTDGTNLSSGIVLNYLREGASRIEGVSMSQVDKADGYDAKVEWEASKDASSIKVTATNGSRTINETIDGKATSFIIPDVKTEEEWTATVVAINDKGASLSSTTNLKIGKTMIGFLSVYATEDELIANGDDDEASAWLWTKSEYPTAKYVYFGNIKNAADLEPYRVLFWLRDLEGVGEDEVLNMPEIVKKATPAIKEWYKNGGNMLLWSHAMPYVEALGRLPEGTIKGNDRNIGTSFGNWNNDVWSLAVGLHPGSKFKKDFSSHPIYKGMETIDNGRCKLISFKGAGWTEDHNCLFFNLPWVMTGIGNQEEACYNVFTETYGIYPLGTWDSQIDWVSQLNVWEAQQGNTEFKGTLICIGNGGCEFSMKNADGTPDKSAYPKNNPYQDNVLKLAKNSLEYLKTR